MLRIIIADAELQLIPESMYHDSAIRRMALKNNKKVGETILDSNYMHTSIDKYFHGESNRRGRPDIIYIFLQVALESILNKYKKLEIYVHTRENYIININPETNLPKSYNRFIGLIEDLYRKKSIESNGKTLLSIKRQKITEFLDTLDGEICLLSPHGEEANISGVISTDNINVIIGGFSQGDYISDLYSKYKAYKIFESELTIWSVGMEVIAQYERYINILK